MLKTLLTVAATAPPFLLLIVGCTFHPVDSSEVVGPDPRDATIFCNIEAGRECATDLDVAMGVDITKPHEDGFWAGRSAAFGLDRSPAALAACGGKPQKVLYKGSFPEGTQVCVNASTVFDVAPGNGSLPGAFTGAYANVSAACKAWCDTKHWIDGDDNHYNCANIAWQAASAAAPVLNACTAAGALRPDFVDLRKFPPQPVVWQDAVGVIVTGSSLQKPGACAPGQSCPTSFDAGAASSRLLTSGDGYLEFTAGAADKDQMIGFASGPLPDLDATPADLRFAIFLQKNGQATIWENGQNKFTLIAYGAGQRFRMAIAGGVLQYFVNDQLFYTSASPLNPAVYPLRVSVSLKDLGASVGTATTSF